MYILHCYRKTILSRLIRLFTKSIYSHTAVLFEWYGVLYVIDAQKDGVKIRTFEDWTRKYGYGYDAHELTSDKYDITDIVSRLRSKDGKTKYDVVSLVFRQPLELITDAWLEANDPYDKMYCSELVAWAMRIREAYKMSPKDLFDTIESSGNAMFIKNFHLSWILTEK